MPVICRMCSWRAELLAAAVSSRPVRVIVAACRHRPTMTSRRRRKSVVALSAGARVPGERRATSRRPVHGVVAVHKLEKLAASTLNDWDWRDDLTSSSAVGRSPYVRQPGLRNPQETFRVQSPERDTPEKLPVAKSLKHFARNLYQTNSYGKILSTLRT